MSSFWMPKKQPLYAPMLSTFGGGSARGFGRGSGGAPSIPISQTFSAATTGRTGSYQTVQAAGTYTIEVVGAQPPQQTYQYPRYDGGKAARLVGTFTFTEEVTLQLLVGQRPPQQQFHGGGGGSFVAVGTSYGSATPLIVAGGGGSMRCGDCGGRFGSAGGSFTDMDASFPSAVGNESAGKNTARGNGGTGGQGGQDGQNSEGQAGAGFYGNADSDGSSNTVALSFVNGGTGGIYNSTGNGEGGFGGGGGGGWGGSGGGGGYNGGGTGSNCYSNAAGGGGSYITSSYSAVLNSSGLYTTGASSSGHNGFIVINGG